MQSEQDHMIEIVFICLSVVTLVHRAKQTIVKKEKEGILRSICRERDECPY